CNRDLARNSDHW
nr:immunoglobulin heavy chain junction region [Macaca mulatta]MOW24043.1 immunoglobulin heavy chain junction region [Macaca mulatta]MOW24875.1 immunoglobulin heavy chain junction region [Macaca mulatta]MOW25335.1 immunoglobulin heavy chain junction region [Macaca mulatta]MOW25573.1 immunoglobulin heavy chain junction region [Macaca mulatta]